MVAVHDMNCASRQKGVFTVSDEDSSGPTSPNNAPPDSGRFFSQTYHRRCSPVLVLASSKEIIDHSCCN